MGEQNERVGELSVVVEVSPAISETGCLARHQLGLGNPMTPVYFRQRNTKLRLRVSREISMVEKKKHSIEFVY